jgi:serine/threonine protein kinase
LREIKLLQKLHHDNILNINEVVYEKQPQKYGASKHHTKPPSIYLCLDLMEFDLHYLIKQHEYNFTLGKIQNILRQVLQGLSYLHEQNVAHRDIKPANILINHCGVIKVADFGLAKKLAFQSTVKVCTMWYRAPELFLGYKQYTPNIDVWSVGCIAVEFLLK